MAECFKRIFRNRMEKFKLRKNCYICNKADFVEILDLGEMPPANSFLEKNEFQNEERFPLAVQLCKNCKSLQLRHLVLPELLFKNYHYATGASKPLVEHFYELADEIADKHACSKDNLVIEIGSNDGILLSRLKNKCRILGVDPANNMAEIAIKSGVPTRVGFFSSKLSKRIKKEEGRAKIIVANNVMAHIDDLRDVFLGVKNLLAEDGKFIFEVHWVGNLLTDGGFDQIYHEHLYYHSLSSLKILLESLEMFINDVKVIPIHGRSLRVYAGLSKKSSTEVKKLLDREFDMGLTNEDTYVNFSKKVELNKSDLVDLLNKLKKSGKKIVGYGAPAKGNTLLNYFQIGSGIIDYITDTTPNKQGKYTPGSHIQVVSPERLKVDHPDYAVLLSWNYADAILEKEKALRDKGVKFIIPVPEVRIV